MMHNAMAMMFERDVPLAPMTTLGVGGPAKILARARSLDDIREIAQWAAAHGEPLLVLGGGSNVVVSDDGWDGAVLRVELRGIDIESQNREEAVVKVAAGEAWDDFVAFAVARDWAGIECLSGIPGSAGATPIQNVGAYGQDVSETIVRVDAFDTATRTARTLTNRECGFGYRSSAFKTVDRGRFIVAAVAFRLRPGGAASLRYPELQKILDGKAASLQQVRDAVLAIRRRKGMVLDPSDPDTRSDGSFFMNPVIAPKDFQELCARAGVTDVPVYPAGDQLKLSAAWLIENAGFRKGFAHGNAAISSKHTLAITNRGGATAREILELAEIVREGVRKKFGIELQAEPRILA